MSGHNIEVHERAGPAGKCGDCNAPLDPVSVIVRVTLCAHAGMKTAERGWLSVSLCASCWGDLVSGESHADFGLCHVRRVDTNPLFACLAADDRHEAEERARRERIARGESP